MRLPPAPHVLAYALGAIAGAALFFVAFAAVFNGLWPVLLAVAAGYFAASAVAVSLTRARPLLVALALAAPALPWIGWLFPAAALESGLLSASVWPAGGALLFLLAWCGGLLAELLMRRRSPDSAARGEAA